jgi:murein DD-endopeptidase MepM/ murein hydrolase activator NlpD
MLRFFILFFVIVIGLPDIKAQYVNTDSLILLPGFEEPLTIIQFDSLLYASPDAELNANEAFYYSRQLNAGRLLENFTIPSAGKVISRYGPRSGRMHTGTDLKLNKGDTIYASYYGTVTRAKYYYGYGNMVVIDHGSDLETGYAHLSAFLVKQGDLVKKGQPIGLGGSTGRATTNHLHFEIKEGNRHFNPELVFDFENGIIKKEVWEVDNLADLRKDTSPVVHHSNEPVPQHYVVKSGDTLWKIARRYRTTIDTLSQLNNLNQNSVLRIGTRLKLY